MNKELSVGERRIRTEFNPANDTVVQNIKERAAEFINYVVDNVTGNPDDVLNSEIGRLKSIALTKIEEAALFAVKAATTNL